MDSFRSNTNVTKVSATITFIVAICLMALWYHMIKASYEDDGHQCKSKLWARYVGYILSIFATISFVSSGIMVYRLYTQDRYAIL